MPSSRESRVVKIALIVFFIAIIIYAIYEAQGLLNGPIINISGRAMLVDQPYIQLTGTTTHIAELDMDGTSIPVTESGSFTIPYVLSPGYNRIVLDAKDKYGKTTERVIEIVYDATSTATSTNTFAPNTPMSATVSTASTSSVAQ
jgi:hypothetical protein